MFQCYSVKSSHPLLLPLSFLNLSFLRAMSAFESPLFKCAWEQTAAELCSPPYCKLTQLWYQCLRHVGVFHDCIDRILSDKILSRLVLSGTHGLFTPKGDWDDESGQVFEQHHLLSSWRLLTAAALDTGRGRPRDRDLKSEGNVDWCHRWEERHGQTRGSAGKANS